MMIKPVKVRETVFGKGLPKICVPIVDISKEDILNSAKSFKEARIDLVEWRVDFFEGIYDAVKVNDVLRELRAILGSIPILFTIRTSNEGGNIAINEKEYIDVNINAIKSGYIDMIDVEMFMSGAVSNIVINEAHNSSVKVVGSNHDFEKTPDMEEIISRLKLMQSGNADILKIAVMPKTKKDVLMLLLATNEMCEKYSDRPVITMSMGRLGAVSRISGQLFGSAVTFGTVNAASAPGQLEVGSLREILNILDFDK